MSENPDKSVEQPKMLSAPEPEKKEKERTILHLDIDLDDLLTYTPKIETPENQRLWKDQKEMSKEYIEFAQMLQYLALHIARCINEGPEVCDNVNKRLILARILLGIIVDNLAINGYSAYGMLMEMQQELFMKASGKKHVLGILAQLEQMKQEMTQKNAQSYTS